MSDQYQLEDPPQRWSRFRFYRLRRGQLAVCAIAAVVLTWPVTGVGPSTGDGSWHTALHLARLRNLRWGSEISYTFGPLGYLTKPLAVSGRTGAEGLLFYALFLGFAFVMLQHLAARSNNELVSGAPHS